MKRTRILSFLLVLAMLASACTLFSSCTKEGEIKLSSKKATLDLSSCVVIYPDNKKDAPTTTTFSNDMNAFATAVSAAVGTNVRAYTVSRSQNAKASVEILVGNTGRTESAEVLSSIKGHGYAIRVMDNKIVIVGSSNLLTLEAVRYFTENYLTGDGSSSNVEVHESAQLNGMEMLTLATTAGTEFSVVHSQYLDTEAGAEYGDAHLSDGIDYAYELAKGVQNSLTTITELKKSELPLKTDTSEATGGEIIIGLAEREAAASVRATLPGDGYGVVVREGKVVVTAWNTNGLRLAGERFLDYIKEGTVKNEDGTVSVMVPANMTHTGTAESNWVLDFPKPEGEGIELYNTLDGADDSLQFLYMGDGVNADAFHAYCETLESNGYSALQAPSTVEDSCFATFVNSAEKKTVYVAYNAFKHAEGSGYANTDPCLRVISAPLSTVNLPTDKMLRPNNYTKKCDSAITAVMLPSGSTGTGYVMRLENGQFVIFDGGNTASNKGIEATTLYEILVDLHTQANGELTKSNPIHIAAWIISHGHNDHYNVLREFSQLYGTKGLVKVDCLLGNWASREALYASGSVDMSFNENVFNYGENFTTPYTYIKVHTGQKLYFGNMEIEVLYTHEDLNPHHIVTYNDTSTLMRVTLNATEEGTVKDSQSFMWTGDAYKYSGRWMCAMYGDYIQCDMVAISHHGGPGMETHVYDTIAPTTVWWPHTATAAHTGYLKNSNWFSKVDQHIYNNIPSVEYVFISDVYNITLYLRPDGPDYENLYGAGAKGGPIDYDGYATIKK